MTVDNLNVCHLVKRRSQRRAPSYKNCPLIARAVAGHSACARPSIKEITQKPRHMETGEPDNMAMGPSRSTRPSYPPTKLLSFAPSMPYHYFQAESNGTALAGRYSPAAIRQTLTARSIKHSTACNNFPRLLRNPTDSNTHVSPITSIHLNKDPLIITEDQSYQEYLY